MKIRLITVMTAVFVLLSTTALVSCKNEKKDGKRFADPNNKYLVLVNKSNTVGADYVPSDLISLNSAYTTGGKSIQLESAAAAAVIDLIDAMGQAGINNVSVTSGYRDYNYQKQLFDRYCGEEKASHPDWSDTQVKNLVLTYSAYPGTSEHQTGLCVDLFTTEMSGLWNYGSETPNNPYDKGFAETKAFEWLSANAYKYGFILRFPSDKTDITGYAYESWHYRYVGVNAATEIYNLGVTLEEYLSE